METVLAIALGYTYVLGTIACILLEPLHQRYLLSGWVISFVCWWFILPSQLWDMRRFDVYDPDNGGWAKTLPKSQL